jgi:tetratricopeptide (TPR) repeat protein
VELTPNDNVYQNTLGVAQYRVGEYAAAVETLHKSIARNAGLAYDFFFLSMAHRQLGNSEESTKWYDQAVAWTEKHDPYNPQLQLFRAETEELIGMTKAKAPLSVGIPAGQTSEPTPTPTPTPTPSAEQAPTNKGG